MAISLPVLNRFRRAFSANESPAVEMFWDDGDIVAWDDVVLISWD